MLPPDLDEDGVGKVHEDQLPKTPDVLFGPVDIEVVVIRELKKKCSWSYQQQVDGHGDLEAELKAIVIPKVIPDGPNITLKGHPVKSLF